MKNWKTTVLGVAAAGAMIFGQHYTTDGTVDPKAPPLNAGNVAAALLIAGLGAMAKDHNNRD